MNGWTDDAHYFEETINISRVKKLLDNAVSANGVPKALEGMKWLLAQISKGRDVSDLFSSVVKIVSTKSQLKSKSALTIEWADGKVRVRADK